MFGDTLVFTTEIQLIEGDVIVASNKLSGTSPDRQADWLDEFVSIFVLRDDRLHRLENFGADDLDAAMTRADELLGVGPA